MDESNKNSNKGSNLLLPLILFILLFFVVFVSVKKNTDRNQYYDSTESSGNKLFKNSNNHTYIFVVDWTGQSPAPIIHYSLPDESGNRTMKSYSWRKGGTFKKKASFSANCQHSKVFFRLYIDDKLVEEASPSSQAVSLSYNYE